MSKTYNGHESHAAWNVALWFGNHEPMYRMGLAYKRRYKNCRKAAAAMMEDFTEEDITQTPDGVKYSKHNIELALRFL